MGCFSYICKQSGLAVNSTSFIGDEVYMFLLENGKVIEEMFGNYDSYGKVFDVGEWKKDWGDIVNWQFGENKSYGIAVVLASYYDGVPPKTRSEQDNNQGWNEVLFYNEKTTPYHKIYE